ncbi:rab3 GTPase-activating protein non-catalytic subunit-like, partial [Paramacrobiotus metropolitanus]|uniref:rab3 GTPase-activating protein non-catalytic subunit-like n=1 Tax=Paramacrobiotus metropolitanus TaxID=2943436 RepID=UPI0024457FAC
NHVADPKHPSRNTETNRDGGKSFRGVGCLGIQYCNTGLFSETLPSSPSRDQSPLKNPSKQSDDEATSTDESEEQRRLWTQHVLADISCDGKFLVLASQREISILTSKWRSDKLVFTKLWNGQLAGADTDAEVLTCCIALPLSSRQRTSDGLPDWTCVIYGFRSGYVAFHTESGYTVHRQKFDASPVRLIKIHSPQYTRVGDAQSVQELIILYENGAVVFINGLHLYSSLQNFKLAAANATAKGKGEDDDLDFNSIPHEKFQLDSQQDIRDIISLGSVRINLFDQLLNASVMGGSSAAIKTPLPTYRRFISVGTKPFYASYFVMEGETPLVIGQMARDIAGRVSQAVTSRITATANRFGLGGLLSRAMPAAKETVEKKTIFVPKAGRDVDARFSLLDARRIATNVVLSDKSRLAALTDNFGRVLLMDCSTGVIIRMWKGYRAAEVAWITVADPKSSADSKYVECLVIYAPRRHLLEVWSPLSFRRLIAIHVSQGLRLLPVGTGTLSPTFEVFHRPSECYFLDLTGNVYILNVPFYLTEEGIDEANAQDLQTVQQAKEMVMYGKNVSTEKIVELFGEIASIEVKDQLVQFFCMEGIAGKQDGLMRVLRSALEDSGKVKLDEKEKNIVREWKVNLRVLEWYEQMIGQWMEYDDANPLTTGEGDTSNIFGDLDTSNLFSLMHAVSASALWKSSIQSRHWDYDWRTVLYLLDPLPGDSGAQLHFTVNPEAIQDERLFLADILYRLYFLGKMPLSELMEKVGILHEDDLSKLLLEYWLVFASEHFEIRISGLRMLAELFHTLLAKRQPSELRSFRHTVEDSTKLAAAITACLAILNTSFPGPTEDLTEVDDWETVCKEKIEWARLSQRLESLLALQAFICRFATVDNTQSSHPEFPNTSVTSFLQHGKSAAAEYLSGAAAASILSLPPAVILKAFYHTDVEMHFASTELEENNDRPLRFLHIPDVALEEQEITDALKSIQTVFPKSLTADMLLANCAWEMAVAWNKHPENCRALEQSVEYLKDVVRPELRHGVAVLMWKTFLVEKINSCTNLLEKVGKAPKERAYLKEIGMEESDVELLLLLTHRILSVIFTLQAEFDSTVATVTCDELWMNENTAASKSSLAELALCQPMSNAALVQHHMILVTVLQAIIRYNVKTIKPMALFDFKAQEAFYKELTQFPLLSVVAIDQNIVKARNQFLIRCLSAMVRTAADHVTRPDVAWLERILEVAHYWGLSGDTVRTLYVCELYSHGLDELGEEAYKTVTDKGPLQSKLLSLAGQRLKSLLANTLSQTDYANYLSSMSPFLMSWIKSLEGRNISDSSVDWEKCQLLLRNISHDLRSNHPDSKICVEALEWMQNHRPQSQS